MDGLECIVWIWLGFCFLILGLAWILRTKDAK